MNGPQHYAEAEMYLNSIEPGDDLANVAALASAAQAHATLALVATNVQAGDLASDFWVDGPEWAKAVRKS